MTIYDMVPQETGQLTGDDATPNNSVDTADSYETDIDSNEGER